MNYKKEVEHVENVISKLKILKKELLATEKKSIKARDLNGTPKQNQKASTDLNFQCMALDKQRKLTWKAILDADLEVSIEDCEYRPSGFHTYNHIVN